MQSVQVIATRIRLENRLGGAALASEPSRMTMRQTCPLGFQFQPLCPNAG